MELHNYTTYPESETCAVTFPDGAPLAGVPSGRGKSVGRYKVYCSHRPEENGLVIGARNRRVVPHPRRARRKTLTLFPVAVRDGQRQGLLAVLR